MTFTSLTSALTVTSTRITLAVGLLVVLAPGSEAQRPTPGPARVTLVASANVSHGKRTEVVRRAQRSPQNVVLVDVNATAEDLAGALAMVQALRFQFGDSLTADVRARPEAVRHSPTWQQSEYRKWLVQQLVRLRQARPSQVSDLGVVSAVQITLPFTGGTITSMGPARP